MDSILGILGMLFSILLWVVFIRDIDELNHSMIMGILLTIMQGCFFLVSLAMFLGY